MFTEKDEHTVKQKMEEIEAMLKFLEAEYDLHYMLNYVKLNETESTIIMGDTIMNEKLDTASCGLFLNNTTNIYQRLDDLNSVLAAGNTLVRCEDDNFPPNIGQKPDKNKVYIVDGIVRTAEDGVFCYVLRGLAPNPPYQGYSSKRFSKLMSKAINN